MERGKSVKAYVADGAICARARSDLLHHVDAISLALKNWNDTEALKLLRLHWPEIARAVRGPEVGQDFAPDLPEGIALARPQRDAVPSGNDRISPFGQVMDSPANDSGISPSPLRTFP
jgi:hypothetical protein